jgi:hypothetical protein
MASEFAQQNSANALHAIDFSMEWAREFAEQSLNQNKVAFVGFWKVGKKLVEDLEKQSSAVRQRTTALLEMTVLNALDFGQKWLCAKEPNEFIQLQNEFISRQAQVFLQQTPELGQETRQAAQRAMLDVYDRALEATRSGEAERSFKGDPPARRNRA